MVEKKEIKSGLTPRALIIGIILLVLWVMLTIFASNYGITVNVFVGSYSMLFPFFIIAALPMLLAALLPRLRRIKLNPQELTVIWTILLIGVPISFSGFLAGRGLLNAMYSQTDEKYAPLAGWAPSFWAPPVGEISNALPGGMSPNWSLWATPIVFWVLVTIVWGLMCIFMMQLFRRPWVEVERLTFVLAQPIQELSTLTTVKKLRGEERRKWVFLAIGMILGILWYSEPLLRIIIPEIAPRPSPFQGVAWANWIELAEELWPYLPNAYVRTIFEPAMIACFILAPLNVTLSAIMFWLIFWVIIPPIETAIGLTSPPVGVSSDLSYLSYGFAQEGQLGNFILGEYGMLFGVAIWALILQRKFLFRTFKAIFKRGTIDETGEPLSYRATWIGLIVCALGFYGALVISGAPWSISIFTIVWLLIGYIGGARLRAETGGVLGHPEYIHLHGQFTTRLLFDGNYYNSGFYVSAMWHQFFQRDAANVPPAISTLEAYNVAHTQKTRNRDVFIASTIGLVIATITSVLLFVNWMYIYGALAKWTGEGWGNASFFHQQAMTLAEGGFWDHKSYAPNIWGQAVAGVLFAILLNVVRLRIPWLPLNPVAAPLVMSMMGPYWWLPLIIAWVLKYTTVQVGGTKLYERMLMPATVGFLAGTILIWAVGIIYVLLTLV